MMYAYEYIIFLFLFTKSVILSRYIPWKYIKWKNNIWLLISLHNTELEKAITPVQHKDARIKLRHEMKGQAFLNMNT